MTENWLLKLSGVDTNGLILGSYEAKLAAGDSQVKALYDLLVVNAEFQARMFIPTVEEVLRLSSIERIAWAEGRWIMLSKLARKQGEAAQGELGAAKATAEFDGGQEHGTIAMIGMMSAVREAMSGAVNG